ncbi:protein bride of sevenless [Uranotaenia lowii]|uniref:protein bride of sevenless n=1 Tax=Uranotaenia lowii TaxID=190385 RepID=UPI00247A3BE4|nr:protein bride of sevenless [Uranotaenia lowii]XP_055612259.1 protein bride of sevenless [Uranotaenia lowii]XP_055612260.1 protein bride of sevenless [Uranotaenia lowii]XP_055612261.1 protein bride of sevenless [Uranotaenia lowii]XP_055612262.1 protein bride of sevenless [Uranotaenia lowii]
MMMMMMERMIMMRRENGCCYWLRICILAFLFWQGSLLPFRECGAQEAVQPASVIARTAASQNLTPPSASKTFDIVTDSPLGNISRTAGTVSDGIQLEPRHGVAKLLEDITDNSILISPTSSDPYLDEIAALGTSTSMLLNENEANDSSSSLGEFMTEHSTVAVRIPDINITHFIRPTLVSETGQLEPAISGQADDQLLPESCSNYVLSRNIIDLSINGDYRHTLRPFRRPSSPSSVTVSNNSATVEEPDLDNITTVYALEGDFTISLITDEQDFGGCLFVVDRINELQLINDNGTLGLRIVLVQNKSHVPQLLEEEVAYLRECVPQSIGIFVAASLWPSGADWADEMDYSIYPFAASNDLLYTNAAHLLYELPWSNPNSSIAVRSESLECSNKFTAICRHEHLCLENFPSDDTIFIILGVTKSVSFATNGTLIVVLSGHDMLFLSDLPDKSYVITENEISLMLPENRSNLLSVRYGSKLLASDILSAGSVFLEVVKLLNLPADGECKNKSATSCDTNFNETLSNWKYYARLSAQHIVTELKLDSFTQMMTFELRQKFSLNINSSEGVMDLRPVASSNMVTNVTTVFQLNEFKDKATGPLKLGNIFYCSKEFEIRHPDYTNSHRPIYYGSEYVEMFWQIKQEPWVAAGLTVASLGILFCMAILIFLIVRVCMEDVLEGNPLSSILLLIGLIVQFASFIPFSLEYTGYMPDLLHKSDAIYTWNTLCTIKIFLVSICYCITFSLLLCRAIMLASIGSEGGFLSHVNGYLQSVICGFSTLVQLGLSTQLVIMLHANAHNISCNEIYYGNWFWAVISYDGILLAGLIFLSPFIFRSQRNYREGVLLVTGSVLCLIIWTTWIPLCMFGYEWREAAVSLGMVATALAVLVGVMIPRCFLMVRSIARSDLVQALPSLTSLAFAQTNQYVSEQSVYECVNPAMRQPRSTTTETFMDPDLDDPYMATSEIPTLPLRGGNQHNRYHQTQETPTANGSSRFYGISNPYSCSDSLTSELSPNKITRF